MRLPLAALLIALATTGASQAQPSAPATTPSAAMPQAGTPPAGTSPTSTPGMTSPTPARPRTTMSQRFESANTTHDGKLTVEQARAGRMRRVAKNFAAIDTAHRGYVTMDDIRTFNRAQRQARKAAR